MNFQDLVLTDDSLRAVIDTVLSAPPYQWTETEPQLGWLARGWRALVDWIGVLKDNNPAAADVLFWSLIAILVLIFLHGGWIMYQAVLGAAAAEGPAGSPSPVIVRDAAWFQRLADVLAAEGRYPEAMQAAFSALVLRLDARGILRYHPSKTAREYAREARLAEDSRARLEDSVRQLYAHAYAGRPGSAGQYRDWQRQLGGEWHAALG